MLLGTYVKSRRLTKNLTLRQLASQVGVSAAFINQIEHGYVVPSDSRLPQFAAALDVGVDYLSLLAGRVPQDVLTVLRDQPALLKSIRSSASAQ